VASPALRVARYPAVRCPAARYRAEFHPLAPAPVSVAAVRAGQG
jgi:hypothetical protein